MGRLNATTAGIREKTVSSGMMMVERGESRRQLPLKAITNAIRAKAKENLSSFDRAAASARECSAN